MGLRGITGDYGGLRGHDTHIINWQSVFIELPAKGMSSNQIWKSSNAYHVPVIPRNSLLNLAIRLAGTAVAEA